MNKEEVMVKVISSENFATVNKAYLRLGEIGSNCSRARCDKIAPDGAYAKKYCTNRQE